MRAILGGFVVAGFMLAGCGSGVSTPENLRGTWAEDCASPFIKIDAGQVHVYPDNADYTLKSATFDGTNFTISYDSSAGAVTETYVAAGDTLRLDHGTYAGAEATWQKQPMKKC